MHASWHRCRSFALHSIHTAHCRTAPTLLTVAQAPLNNPGHHKKMLQVPCAALMLLLNLLPTSLLVAHVPLTRPTLTQQVMRHCRLTNNQVD